MGAEGCKFADQLSELLTDKSSDIRNSAVMALGKMAKDGNLDAKYLDQVIKLFNDIDVRVAASAMLAATDMGGNPEVTKLLTQKLKSQHPVVRSAAATSVGTMGQLGSGTLEALLKCFGDRSPQVRVAAVSAMAKLGRRGECYAADVARTMFDRDATVRLTALETLPKMGARGAAFVEDMVDALQDPEPEVREAAVKALGSLGVGAKLALQNVEMMQTDADKDIAKAAEEACKNIMGQ